MFFPPSCVYSSSTIGSVAAPVHVVFLRELLFSFSILLLSFGLCEESTIICCRIVCNLSLLWTLKVKPRFEDSCNCTDYVLVSDCLSLHFPFMTPFVCYRFAILVKTNDCYLNIELSHIIWNAIGTRSTSHRLLGLHMYGKVLNFLWLNR